MGYVDLEDRLRSTLIVLTMAVAQWDLLYQPSGVGLAIEEATG